MKRFLSGLAFGLFIITSVAAQCNTNGGQGNNGYGQGSNGNNGQGNNGYGQGGNGNNGYGQGGNGNNAYGQGGNSPWANVNWPQWLINWLENGGQVPPLLASKVIWEARAWGQQNFSLSYGQMLQRYAQGQLTLQYLSTAPPSLTFRVSFGGGNIIVVADL